MKKLITLAFLFLFGLGAIKVNAQTWNWDTIQPFANGSSGSGRENAMGFIINGKMYEGTGYSTATTSHYHDFWEYNPATNQWTQKADYPGNAFGGVRTGTGFSINGKGYMGFSFAGGNNLNDFYEYDPINNWWTEKATFPGAARRDATGFSIGTKGYIACGALGGGIYSNELWEYNPSDTSNGYDSHGNPNGAWNLRAQFGGAQRMSATCFVIGNKAFVGSGYINNPFAPTNDFFEFDPANGPQGTWTSIASLPGAPREEAVAFSIGSKGYVGCGQQNGFGYLDDFYEYDTLTGNWAQLQNVPGGGRYSPVGFSVGNKGYIGTGDVANSSVNDFYEYSATPNICLVTTDSINGNNQYNSIYWEKANLVSDVDSIIIYRNTLSGYLRIGAVVNNVSTLSRFVDNNPSIGGPNGGNPIYSYYQYKIKAKDINGVESNMSPYHTSVYVPAPTGSAFDWNDYQIENQGPIPGYTLMKDSLNNGNWVAVGSTTGTLLNDPYYTTAQSYRVDAAGFTCDPTRSTVNTTRSNIRHGIVVGLENKTNNSISIYPNPANNLLTIQTTKPLLIEIYSLEGNLIESKKINSTNSFGISNYANGMYLIKTTDNSGGFSYHKLVKQ